MVSKIIYTSQFQRSFKKLKKQHKTKAIIKIEETIKKLANFEITTEQRNHKLQGTDLNDIHIEGDIILLYKYEDELLTITLLIKDIVNHKELQRGINMKISTRKSSKEAVTLGQVDGVVVNGGGPVNITDFRKDFEEAAAKLEKLIKIGNTTTGEGKPAKAEQLKIEPDGTPNPAKKDKKKESAAGESIIDRNSKPKKTLKSFEDFCEYPEDVCVIPGAGGDIDEWKNGICQLYRLKNKPEFTIFNGQDLNAKYGFKGNAVYPNDYVFLAFPVDELTRKSIQSNMSEVGAKWFKDLIN